MVEKEACVCEAGGRYFWRDIHVQKAACCVAGAVLCFVQAGLVLYSASSLLILLYVFPMAFFGGTLLFNAQDEYDLRDTPPSDWLARYVEQA